MLVSMFRIVSNMSPSCDFELSYIYSIVSPCTSNMKIILWKRKKKLRLRPLVLKPSWSSRPKQYFLFNLSVKVVHKLKLIKTNISNHRFNPLFFKLLGDKRDSLYFNFCHYYYYIADWKIISASSCRVLFQTIISVFKRNKNRFLTCTCLAEGTLGSPNSLAFFSRYSKSALPSSICFPSSESQLEYLLPTNSLRRPSFHQSSSHTPDQVNQQSLYTSIIFSRNGNEPMN